MQRRIVWCAVALLVAALQATTASALGRPFQIGIGGGASVPVGDAADAFKTGFHAKAMLKVSAPVLPLSFRGSVGYERFNLEGLTPGTDGTGRILSGLANVAWGFPVGPVKPYLLGGVGAFNMKSEVGGTSSPSQTKLGIDGGAGVEFSLGVISGFVEGRVENIFTSDQGVGGGQPWDTRIIPVTFGVYF